MLLLRRELGYPRALLLIGLIVAMSWPSWAQVSVGSAQATEPSTTDEARSVSGRVVNAMTGQPVSRALVRLAGQAVLADQEGKFEISGVTDTSVSIQVTKPGFYANLDPTRGNGQQVNVAALDGPIEIRLYPEALITGTVTAASGDPLSGVLVEALRSTVDESGQRWIHAGQTTTNSRGEFRLPVSPGDYAVEIPYLPQNRDLQEAVLPLIYPPVGSSVGLSSIHAESGTEQQLDLQPETRPTHVVRFHMESDRAEGFPLLQARLNSNQLTMPLGVRSSGTPGEVSADLPTGSYTIIGTLSGREGQEQAEATVTVGERDVSGVVLRFSTVPSVPVEVMVDATAAASISDAMSTNSPPNPQQLGLSLHRSDNAPDVRNPSSQLVTRSNEAPAFHVAPGRYRIYARSGGPWYVKAVSAAGIDLLTQDLVVAAGSTGGILRVVVSNQTAVLKGTLRVNGQPARATLWLIATDASASPLIELRSSADGSFNRAHLAPGAYLAIGFESSPSGGLLDPGVQGRYSAYAKPFQAAAGETENLDLDAVPATELNP